MKQTLLTIYLILFALPCGGQTQGCYEIYKSQFSKAMIKHGYIQERDRMDVTGKVSPFNSAI
tara:strand:- start:188 stop:373 length:186 start_codon:yes stop_codon:yes gene_type:complete